MKASLAAHLLAPTLESGGDIKHVSFDELRDFAIGAQLVPADGTAVVVPGERLAQLAPLDQLEAIESRINGLRMEVTLAAKPDKNAALRQSVHIAETSQHPHELHYLLAMFIHHKEVLRALAANKNLAEADQRQLAMNAELAKDKGLQRVLAANPALSASVMRTMLATTDDSMVQLRVAENAAKQALTYDGENDFAVISESLLKESFDGWVRIAAIEGVRDPELLRDIATTHDNVFGARERAAVAANRYTPPDVLEDMTSASGIRGVMQGILQTPVSSAIGRLAQQNLEKRRGAEAAATLYHSSPD